MRYLFFDIECANCFNGQGKICSFGYVITDTQFNVLEQKDILINPKTKFHLTKNNNEDGIELAYPIDMFTSSPDFEYYYETIRNLLTYKDQIVFGHSVLNDIHFILSECKRYNKEIFTYKAYDTQVFYMLLHNESMPAALSKICEGYGIELTALHRSDFDAYLTMQVLVGLCKEYKVSLEKIFEMQPKAFYTINKDGSVVNNFQNKSNTKKLFEYARRIATPILPLSTPVSSKHFCFCKEFEESSYKQALYLVRELRLKGGYFCTKPSRCEYYLKTVSESETDEKVKKVKEQGKNIEEIDIPTLLDFLDIDKETYDKI